MKVRGIILGVIALVAMGFAMFAPAASAHGWHGHGWRGHGWHGHGWHGYHHRAYGPYWRGAYVAPYAPYAPCGGAYYGRYGCW